MTTENKKMIAALLRERSAYEKAGKEDRVEQVNKSLRFYGYKSEPDSQEVRRTPPQGRSERPTVTGQQS